MVVNGDALLLEGPIKDMEACKRREHGVSFGLAEVGYDIRIKQSVSFFPATPNLPEPKIIIGKEARLGRFVLASAIEEFMMPTNLVGIVHDKSTWARQGLSVFNTVIEPGWNGFLTLELVFHGSEQVHIPAGAGIAQVVFHRLMSASQYHGKYQNQEDRPVDSVFD